MFPRFKFWIQALRLCCVSYFTGAIAFSFSVWVSLGVVAILAVNQNYLASRAGGVFLVLTLAGIGYHWVLIGLSWAVIKLFWKNPPEFIKPPAGIGSGFWHWFVAWLSTLPIALIYVLNLLLVGSTTAIVSLDIDAIEPPVLALYLFPLFIVCAAYLYGWQHKLFNSDTSNRHSV